MATFEQPGVMNISRDTVGGTADSEYDSDFSDTAYQVHRREQMISKLSTDQTEAWLHFKSEIDNWGSGGADYNFFKVYDDLGNTIVSGVYINGSFSFYRNTTGSGVRITTPGRQDTLQLLPLKCLDIHIKISSTVGVIDAYYDGYKVHSFTGDTEGSFTGRKVSYVLFHPAGDSDSYIQSVSEILWGLGDSPTVGARVFCKAPTGESATNAAWTGAYTDVNSPVRNDDYMVSETASQRHGFTFPDLPTYINAIRAVSINTVGAGFGTFSYAPSVRISSTDYDQTDAAAVDDKAHNQALMTTSPATTNPWTRTEINGAEFGVVSS